MYDLSQSEFSSDIAVTVNGEEFFELATPPTIENCIAIRFIFKAPGDCVLLCYRDDNDGLGISFESGVLNFCAFESGVQYTAASNALELDTYHFVEFLVNISTGDCLLWVNGEDQLSSNAITGLTDISNNDTLRLGGTNRSGMPIGEVTVVLATFTSYDNWFTSLTGFVSEYENYILNHINPDFPFGGPNAYQMIDESRQSYLQTASGSDNLIDEISFDNYAVSPIVNWKAKDYIDDDTPVDDFSIEKNLPDSVPVYEYTNQFTSDESALFTGNQYLSKDSEFTATYGDIVIEAVFKCDGTSGDSYVFGYGNFVTTTRMYLKADNSAQVLSLNIVDSLANSITYTLPSGQISTNAWNHVMFILKRSGSLLVYINGERIETASVTALTGSIYTSGNYFYIGNFSTEYNDDDIYVTTVNIWEQYDWLLSSDYDDMISSRYDDYINGGIDYHVPIPLTVYSWGDDIGTYPMVMTLDKDNKWILQYTGSPSSEQLQGEFTVNDGIYGIRLFSKFEEDGWSNFDDIQSALVSIEKLQIEKKYKRVFERLILQTKPLGTWAVVMVEWI